jgi:hypothetical protein
VARILKPSGLGFQGFRLFFSFSDVVHEELFAWDDDVCLIHSSSAGNPWTGNAGQLFEALRERPPCLRLSGGDAEIGGPVLQHPVYSRRVATKCRIVQALDWWACHGEL